MNVKDLLNCDLGTFGRWVEEHKSEFRLHIPSTYKESYYEYFDENLCVQLCYEDFKEMLNYLITLDGFTYHLNIEDSSVEYCLNDKVILRKFTYSYFV